MVRRRNQLNIFGSAHRISALFGERNLAQQARTSRS